MAKEITLPALRKFNLFMGSLHLVQSFLMIFFSLNFEKVLNFRPPLRTYFLTFDTQTMRLVTETHEAGSLPFGILVASFLFISAVAHFIIAAPRGNKIYNDSLQKGMNPFRWFEYAISSSVMIVLIAALFGVYAIDTLIIIFIANASMNLFGYLMEEINMRNGKTSWTAFIFGCVAGIGPWIVIALNAFGNSDLSKIPWFVLALTFSYFFFFNLFPINMILQYKKIGPWRNYLFGERVYIILSLVAKSVLAWLVFAGVMQP